MVRIDEVWKSAQRIINWAMMLAFVFVFSVVFLTNTIFGLSSFLDTPNLKFDGIDDYVNLNKLDVSGNKLTLEANFNSFDNTNCGSSADCRIIAKSTGSLTNKHHWILSTVRHTGSNQIRLKFVLKTTSKTTTLVATKGAIQEDRWYHAAATYDGTKMRLYLDGINVGTASTTGNIISNTNADTFIGNNPATSKPFEGLIDDVRIWNVARTVDQIENFRHSELDGTELGLLAYYKLNDGSGQTIIDSSPANRQATLGNSTNSEDTDPVWNNLNQDTEPPSVPTNFQLTSSSESHTSLAWEHSTDNTAVAYYNVFRNGDLLAQLLHTEASYSDLAVEYGVRYTYEITAEDEAGNKSPKSPALDVLIPYPEDFEPPTAPTNLTTASIGDTGVQIDWEGSTDNYLVARYLVYRDGVLAMETTTDSAVDTSITLNTEHIYTVYAEDQAGNRSEASNEARVTIQDITAPNIIVVNPAEGQYIRGTSVIEVTTTDNLAVSLIKVYVDGNEIHSANNHASSFDWDSTTVEDGTRQVVLEATDLNGNTRTESIQIEVVNDRVVEPLPGNQHPLFDGRDDRINLGKVETGTGRITVEAWIKSDNFANCTSSDCRIISKSTGLNVGTNTWVLSTAKSNSKTVFRLRAKINSSVVTLTSTTNIPASQWVHVATTYDGSKLQIYQNGNLVATSNVVGNLATAPLVETWVGASQPTGAKPWLGSIDDIRIWSYARSQTEIATSKDQELYGFETGLTAYYKFGEGSGQYGQDVSGNQPPAIFGSSVNADQKDPVWAIIPPDISAPSAPSNLTAIAPFSSQVKLTWQPSTDDRGVAQYLIERGGEIIGTANQGLFTDYTVTPQSSYVYVVYAKDAAGNTSQASDPVEVSTPEVSAPTISNVRTLDNTGSTIKVAWSSADTARSFVEYGLDTNYGTQTDTTTDLRAEHAIKLTNLLPETIYHFRAHSVNDAGESVSEDIEFTTAENTGVVAFERIVVDPSATSPLDPHNKKIADFNNDGKLDIAVASANEGGAFWYEYPSWTKHRIANGSYSTDMETADIDNDGDTDVVLPLGPSGGTVVWLANPLIGGDSSALWAQHVIGFNRAHDLEVADLDNNGLVDVIARGKGSTGNELIFWKNNGGFDSWQSKNLTALDGEGLSKGDINGDGFIDIISTDHWHQNPGSLIIDTEWSAHRFTSAFGAVDTANGTGDFNGDGRPDIVQSNSEAPGVGKFSWFEAPVDPTNPSWQEHQIDTLSEFVHGLRVADFNNDGVDDLVVSEMHQSSDPDFVKVYLNTGNGSSWHQITLSTSGSHNIDVGDIDGDGDKDVVGANWNHTNEGSPGAPIELWRNSLSNWPDGSPDIGSWTNLSVGEALPWRGVFVEHADVDGDGFEDILSGGWWFKNPASLGGSWTQNTIGASFNNVATVYDFDGDGDKDILGTKGQGASSSNELVWAENNGLGQFVIHENIATGDEGDFLQGVAVDRFSADGPLQVALSYHNGGGGVQMLTLPADPRTETWTWAIISTTTQKEQLSAGDIDLDGDKDLLLGTQWLRNNGTSGWSAHIVIVPNGIPDTPDRNRLVDMNNDGRLDAVVGFEAISIAGRLAWYEQPALATDLWIEHIIDDTVVGPMSLDVKDMDFDGDYDVIVGEHNLAQPETARLLIYKNQDTASSGWDIQLVHTGGEHHDGAQVVDLDNDGDYDIISTSWGNSNVTAYFNSAQP